MSRTRTAYGAAVLFGIGLVRSGERAVGIAGIVLGGALGIGLGSVPARWERSQRRSSRTCSAPWWRTTCSIDD